MDLTVGLTGADINGDSNLAIQAAIDRAAATGGGTVTLLRGSYVIWDAIHMRTNTALTGSGPDTLLVKPDGWEAPLWEDGDWGNDWVTVDPLPPVRVGQGVHLYSDHDRGWFSTVATVLDIRDNRIRLSHQLNGDHMVANHARISSACALIDVDHADRVAIRDLAIDGNRAKNPRLDGCRGGAIHGLFANRVRLSRLTVRNFNGDAVSFQRSDDWTVEDCTLEDNSGHGLHPGTGAQRPTLRNCTARRNGNCGLFVCWRVRFAVIEHNTFEENTVAGISNGHKDSDNIFRRNRIVNNLGPALISRNEKFPMCPDRCLFEANIIQGNNKGGPQILILGEVRDLVFRDNSYDPAAPRFEIGPSVQNLSHEPEP